VELPERFEDLPVPEQQRILRAGNKMGELAFQRCTAILVAPPPGSAPGRVNNGSAFVLQLNEQYYLGTAWHVVDAWQKRTASGERLLFQVGHADLPPTGRLAWHSKDDDVAFPEDRQI
jgi:hypothetical protein